MYARLKEFVEQSDSEDDSINNTEENKTQINKKIKKVKKEKDDEDDIQYDYDKEAFKKYTKLKKEDRVKADKSNLNLKEDNFEQENDNHNKVSVDYCELCNKRVNNEKEINEHLISKNHRRKLKNATLNELSQFKKVSDYLHSKGFVNKKRCLSNKLKTILYKVSLKNLISEKF